MISGFEIIVLLFIIAIVVLILSFLGSNFSNSLVKRIDDWCIRKIDVYEKKGVSRFSLGGIIKTVCWIIVNTFKLIDRIGNPKLRTGLKLQAVSIIVSVTLAIIVFLFIAVIYVALILIALYIFYQLMELWYRHEKGLPLFPDKKDKYYSDSSYSSSKEDYYERDGKKYDIKTDDRIIKQDGRTYREDFIRGWVPDKDFLGKDKVETDFLGNPKIEQDFLGNQKIEKDWKGDPTIPPKKK